MSWIQWQAIVVFQQPATYMYTLKNKEEQNCQVQGRHLHIHIYLNVCVCLSDMHLWVTLNITQRQTCPNWPQGRSWAGSEERRKEKQQERMKLWHEMLKNGREVMIDWLLEILQEVWRMKQLPSDWNTGPYAQEKGHEDMQQLPWHITTQYSGKVALSSATGETGNHHQPTTDRRTVWLPEGTRHSRPNLDYTPDHRESNRIPGYCSLWTSQRPMTVCTAQPLLPSWSNTEFLNSWLTSSRSVHWDMVLCGNCRKNIRGLWGED